MRNILMLLTVVGLCFASCKKVNNESDMSEQDTHIVLNGKSYEIDFILNALHISTSLPIDELTIDPKNQTFITKGYDDVYKLVDFLNPDLL